MADVTVANPTFEEPTGAPPASKDGLQEDSLVVVRWLRDWAPMRLLGLRGEIKWSKFKDGSISAEVVFLRCVVYSILISQTVMSSLYMLDVCGIYTAPGRVAIADFTKVAEDQDAVCHLMLSFQIMTMLPITVYQAMPHIFAGAGASSSRAGSHQLSTFFLSVGDKSGALGSELLSDNGDKGGALVECSQYCKYVNKSVKQWLGYIRNTMLILSVCTTVGTGINMSLLLPDTAGSQIINTVTIVWISLYGMVAASVTFYWIQTLLLGTWLIRQGCEDIQRQVPDSVLTAEKWRQNVLDPVKQLATKAIPALSRGWGGTLGLLVVILVVFEVCLMPKLIPALGLRTASDVIILLTSTLPVMALVPASAPAQVSSTCKGLFKQISLLRFDYKEEHNERVELFEAALVNNEVGFQVIGMLITTQRVKGLAISIFALYGTASSLTNLLGHHTSAAAAIVNNTNASCASCCA